MTKKTIQTKQRHLNDLMKSETEKLQRLKDEQYRRENIYTEKKGNIMSLKQSLAMNKIRKANLANEIRQDLNSQKNQSQMEVMSQNNKKSKLVEKTMEMKKKLLQGK